MVRHKYTEEEHAFLRSYVPGHTYQEIIAEYNSRFTEPITASRLSSYIGNHKINTGKTGRFEKGHIPANKGTHPKTVGRMGETQYKKGNLPHNTKPIGYERITKNGYIEVKIAERPNRKTGEKNFKAKHHLVWEKVNGPVPKGYILIFLDGNPKNYDIENLALISRAEHLQMIRQNLRSNVPEFTETGMLIARASVLSKKAKEKMK